MSGSVGTSSSGGSSRPQMNPTQMLNTYNQYLPQTLATAYNQATPANVALAQSAAESNPLYTQSGLSQLQNMAGGYAKTGNDLMQQQSEAVSDLLSGNGADVAAKGAALNNLYNPVQSNNNTRANELVNSINLNGLSPGEQNAVERSLGQSQYATGNLGLDNGMNAVSNAMNFGNTIAGKRAELGNALGTSNAIANSLNTQFNPVSTALASGNTSGNFGLGTFNPTQANQSLTSPITFSSALGGQVAQNASSSRGSSSSNSFQTGGGVNCCFIFLEATNGVMPWWVRECRDEYYVKYPTVAKGYKRLAKILVPLMRYVPIIKSLVNSYMVTPITQYGGYLKNVKGFEHGKQYEPYKNFWFKVWHVIGGL